MYRCTDCNRKFDFVEVVFEKHGVNTPPYERVKRCPYCSSADYVTEEHNCRFCGVKLRATNADYCSDRCEAAGKKYYGWQQKNEDLFKNSSVAAAVREVLNYNKKNSTKYSYGKYFSLKGAGKLEHNGN